MAHVANHGSKSFVQRILSVRSNRHVGLFHINGNNAFGMTHDNRFIAFCEHVKDGQRAGIIGTEPLPSSKIIQNPTLGFLGLGPILDRVRHR